LTYGLPNSGAEMNLYNYLKNTDKLYGLILGNLNFSIRAAIDRYIIFVMIQIQKKLEDDNVIFELTNDQPLTETLFLISKAYSPLKNKPNTKIVYYFKKIWPHPYVRDLYIWLNERTL